LEKLTLRYWKNHPNKIVPIYMIYSSIGLTFLSTYAIQQKL